MGLAAVVIMHGVCVGDWARFTANVVPHALGPIIGLSGQTSIAAAYNTILDACRGRVPDMLILQHDDLEIGDPAAATKLAAAFSDPEVAIVGIAGARGVTSLAWWNFDTVGHQQTDTQMVDFGVRAGDVDALEGSLLVLSAWAVANLRFEDWPGWHGYDVAICRRARNAGKRVLVVDLDTVHHTRLGFKSDEIQTEWFEADRRFRERTW